VRTPSITALCRTETSTSSKNEKMWALHLGSPFRPIRQSTSVGTSIWWYLGVLIVVTAPRRLRSASCGMAGPGSLPMPDHSRLGRSGRDTTGTATAEPSSGGWEVPLFRETKAGFRDRGRRSAPARPHRGRGRTYAQTPDGGCSGARLLEHPPPWLHPPGHCHCPGSAARRGRRLGLRMAVGLHVVPAGPGSAARAVQAAPDAGEPRIGRLAERPPPVDADRSASRTLDPEPFGAGAAEIAKRGHAGSTSRAVGADPKPRPALA
jgi:hypothetical protein